MPPLLFLHPGDPQTGNVGFKKIPRIGLLGEVSKSRRQSLQNQAKTSLTLATVLDQLGSESAFLFYLVESVDLIF